MMDELAKEIQVHAFALGFVDLDEHDCSVALGDAIAKLQAKHCQMLVLDLRKCWIEYSHCSLFLDQALKVLKEATPVLRKVLRIKTSIDLGAIESMACLFFQVSKTLSCEARDGPANVISRLNNYCRTEAIKIEIEVFGFDCVADADQPKKTHSFPIANDDNSP